MSAVPDPGPVEDATVKPLQALVAGRGRPLVLLHAFGLTPAVYQRTIDQVARTHRVIAPWWLRVRSRQWTFERAMSCLEALLEDEGVRDAIVVGHSFGGALATGITARRPDLVSDLVLANALALSPGKQHLRRLGRPGRHWTVLISGRAASGFAGMVYARPRNVINAAFAAYRTDLRPEVETIRRSRVQATVLWTPRDSLLPTAFGRETAEALGGRFHLVEADELELEHDWVYRHPRLFSSVLRDVGLAPPHGGRP